MEVEFSEEAWLTIKTEMPLLARAVKILRFTPMTPTIERPVTFMRATPLMLEIPLISLSSGEILDLIIVPGFSGLNVLSTFIGISFTHTG